MESSESGSAGRWLGGIALGIVDISLVVITYTTFRYDGAIWPAVFGFIGGTAAFALTKGERTVYWRGLRGQRLSALLLLGWSLAILIAWLVSAITLNRVIYPVHLMIGLPLLPPQWLGWGEVVPPHWDLSVWVRLLARFFNDAFFQASVSLFAGVLAAAWRVSRDQSLLGLARGVASGLLVGVIALVALLVGFLCLYLPIVVVFHLTPVAGGFFVGVAISSFGYAVFYGALYGLLGGLVGGRAAIASRRAGERTGIRRPA